MSLPEGRGVICSLDVWSPNWVKSKSILVQSSNFDLSPSTYLSRGASSRLEGSFDPALPNIIFSTLSKSPEPFYLEACRDFLLSFWLAAFLTLLLSSFSSLDPILGLSGLVYAVSCPGGSLSEFSWSTFASTGAIFFSASVSSCS
jgi:hypothetical protein